MSLLTFEINDRLRVIVEYAMKASAWTAAYGMGNPPTEPSLYLVHDSGVYLLPATVEKPKDSDPRRDGSLLVAYAQGLDPLENEDQHETARALVGGSDFVINIPCQPFADAIEAGEHIIQIDVLHDSLVIQRRNPSVGDLR